MCSKVVTKNDTLITTKFTVVDLLCQGFTRMTYPCFIQVLQGIMPLMCPPGMKNELMSYMTWSTLKISRHVTEASINGICVHEWTTYLITFPHGLFLEQCTLQAVLLKHEHAYESHREHITRQIPGLHPQSFWFSNLGVRFKNLLSRNFLAV